MLVSDSSGGFEQPGPGPWIHFVVLVELLRIMITTCPRVPYVAEGVSANQQA